LAVRWLALLPRPQAEKRMLLATPVAGLAVAGLAIAGLAIAFAAGTGKSSSEVRFSGAGRSRLASLLGSDSLAVMPLAIVAVVVAYVAPARLTPVPPAEPAPPGPRRRGRAAGAAPPGPPGPAPERAAITDTHIVSPAGLD
jgi:membrane protease YdiL (CAAX protease family)